MSRQGTNKLVTIHESAVTPVDTGVEMTGIDMSRPHCFLGIKFYTDAAGTDRICSGTGNFDIEVKTYNTEEYEPFVGNTISVLSPTTVSWAANTLAVRITPEGVVGPAYYKGVLTCNET